MRFASAITSQHEAKSAVEHLLRDIDSQMTTGMADLAMFFSTAHFEDELEDVTQMLTDALPQAQLFGCTAEGTIGGDRELERVPSMSLLVGEMPGVQIRPFHIVQSQLESSQSIFDWERLVGVSPESNPVFICFADPFQADVQQFVGDVNKMYPNAPLVGGIASAARAPGENRMITSGQVMREGIVGVTLTGNIVVDTVVSQGCRPIGEPYVITKGDRNVIQELGGKPALRRLQDTIVNLSDDDEELAKQALFVGRVIDEHKATFSHGDFLIHNIVGADRKNGAIGIAGLARVGATVQFHVRDRKSADQDLRNLLMPHVGSDVRAAMLFGCNGRGSNMWDKAGHDIGVVRELLGDVPTAGFFCGGEFGPVGGSNFIHGFTASIALLREPSIRESA